MNIWDLYPFSCSHAIVVEIPEKIRIERAIRRPFVLVV